MKARSEFLNFNKSVFATLEIAKKLAEKYNEKAINTFFYFWALNKIPENAFYQYRKTNDITENEMDKFMEEIAEELSEEAKFINSTIEENEFFEESLEQEELYEEFYLDNQIYADIKEEKSKKVYHITKDLFECFKLANKKLQNKKLTIIKNNDICAAIFSVANEDICQTFELFLIDRIDVEKTFNEMFNIVVHPKSISNCLKDITENVNINEPCVICGREAETKDTIRILMKSKKRNALLIGEPGVGKTAIVEKLAWLIATGNCPDELKNKKIISLDVNSVIAGTTLRGEAEAKFNDIIIFLEKNPNVILFIDEIHTIIGAGGGRDSSLDFANSLKPLLARNCARIIGATTLDEYDKYFSKDLALKRRFETILVKEPKFAEVSKMIKNQINVLQNYHNVKISKKMVDYIMVLSACFYFYSSKNPDRTIDAIDRAMVEAKLKNNSSVTKKNAISAFAINFNKYKKMAITDKMATAYHEVGHYLVKKYSKIFGPTIKTIAISILPSEEYLGVNVFEKADYLAKGTKEMYLEEIAGLLGGRVAEEMFTKTISSGASSDLEKATKIAKRVITQYGLCESFSVDRVYDESLCSEKSKNELNKEIDILISTAKKFAKEILTNHKDELNLIVIELLKKGILYEADLKLLFN